ncbi:serine/threonine-protein kinase [Noviherbaspirillum aridicola]|uniref:Protein kinase domain-containing protein n=1 Tax=Noviherbaspirillum aridicola TaxID=2849687 RepID=A0ABQ4Q193_9BURK|nr:serine/threonine-protein kinase [Noviherbaspirillum aridicola]GIZ50524.1 hypothetical protein NCCP691_05380 [Noviherbaspirillum aridicola]
MNEDRQAAAGRDSSVLSADSRRLDASHALSTGARVDRFDIVDLVGAGESGFVYLAFDHALGRHVALREYLPRGIGVRGPNATVQPATPQQAALFSAGLRSFASEALVLARIESPSLAKVLRYWEGNGTGYAAMPFYEGLTLQRAAQERRIPVDDVTLRMLLGQLLDAVDAVHRAQSCHGNISPADILIRADGRPLLLEFDAARTLLAEMTDTVPAMLKPGFAPVELYPGMKDMLPGAWSDIYSLGAVAWFLITGKAPPPAPERLRNDRMRSAREVGHGKFSPGLLDAIDRALAVRLEQRPASAAAMRELVGTNRAPAAQAPRAQHARDAIRRERESMPAPAADIPRAEAPQVQPPGMPPSAAETVTVTAAPQTPPTPQTPSAPQTAQTQPTPHTPQTPPRPQPAAHEVEPLRGEWRRQPMVAERRVIPSRRSRLPGLLLGALTLSAGVAAGVLIGYPELVMPDAEEEPARAAQAPAAASEDAARASSAPQPLAQGPATAPAPTGSAASRPTGGPASAPAPAARPAAPPAQEAARPQQETRPAARDKQTAQTAQAGQETRATPPAPRAAPQDDARAREQARLAAAEQEEWRIASSIDQAEFYESYLKRYPDGPNAGAARARLAATRQARAAVPSPAPAVPATAAAPATPPAPARAAAASPSPAGPPVEERTARAVTEDAGRLPDTPRYPAGSMSAAPAAEAMASETRRTIRSEGQTLTGEFNADPDSGALSGNGQVVWSNGDRYEGRLVNGSKEGRGQFVWQNGQRYNGDWANNQPNGRGTIVFADGNRYEGDVRNGLPNGRGVLVFSGGGRYEGDVRNGVPHGRGMMVFADGTRYEGEVREGLPHGQGVTRFRNGDVYSGALAKGRSHGQGRFSWSNGLVWEGEFRDGQRTANGRLIGQSRTVASSGAGASPAGNAGE